MDNKQHELYEYARRRLKQKKNLYFHFVLMVIGSLFLFVVNVLLKIGEPNRWYLWIITVWVFLFILHFIKVFITDSFMNKNWEREQINKLIIKQERKIAEFQANIEAKNNQQ